MRLTRHFYGSLGFEVGESVVSISHSHVFEQQNVIFVLLVYHRITVIFSSIGGHLDLDRISRGEGGFFLFKNIHTQNFESC